MRGWSVDRDNEQQQMNNRGWTDGGGGREQNGGRWDRRGEQRWDGGRGGGSRADIARSSSRFPVLWLLQFYHSAYPIWLLAFFYCSLLVFFLNFSSYFAVNLGKIQSEALGIYYRLNK